MNRYEFDFTGRRIGAIGKTYRIVQVFQGTSEQDAYLALWDHYEHISDVSVKITPMDEDHGTDHDFENCD